MWRWRRVAVARVFALVVRCRDMILFVYCRVGKNRDTTRGSPAGAVAGRGASHKTASLVTQLSRHGAAIAYTDLLGCVFFGLFDAFEFILFGSLFFLYIIVILKSKPEFS